MGNRQAKAKKRRGDRPDLPKIEVTPPTPLRENFVPFVPQETMVIGDSPPRSRPPPLPKVPPPDEVQFMSTRMNFVKDDDYDEVADYSTSSRPGTGLGFPKVPPVALPAPVPRTTANPIVFKKNVGNRIPQFESLNTTDRKKEPGYKPPPPPAPETTQSTLSTLDDYPIYNPIEDFKFESGKTFQQGSFPIDAGAGKSTMINALRGISAGDHQAAGRYACDRMEPFRFIEENLQHIVLWEIPYPRTFTNVVDIYDRNMGFDRFYESHKLHMFKRLFVLSPDGTLHDDDIAFARVVHARRAPLTLLSTKTDDNMDAESRESARPVDNTLVKEFEEKARRVFKQSLFGKATALASVELLFVSAPVVRNLVSSTIGYLHYQVDEERLLELVTLKRGCHYELENKQRKETSSKRARQDSPSLRGFPPSSVQRSTVLADAGFEIAYHTDDRIYGNLEPRTGVRRTGKTAFNYGFIGGRGVGKSSLINAMRGMSSRHPLAAGKGRFKRGSVERFEFEDELLKYSVTLWEMHYPKKMNSYFEFIDRHNLAAFTAIFVLVENSPSDEDLSFSKIAHRRDATVVFLASKSDARLSARSRSDEVPVCDLLKQRMARFEKVLAAQAPELCGRVHLFFVSAPVFKALRVGDARPIRFLLHERAVFDFLKQKRIIAEMLDSPGEMKEGLYANVNMDAVDVIEESPVTNL